MPTVDPDSMTTRTSIDPGEGVAAAADVAVAKVDLISKTCHSPPDCGPSALLGVCLCASMFVAAV